MADGCQVIGKREGGERIVTDKRVSAAELEAVGLVAVEEGSGRAAEEGDTSVEGDLGVVAGADMDACVIGVLVGGRCRGVVWEEDRVNRTRSNLVSEVAGEGLGRDDVEDRGQRAALCEAGGDREGGGAPAIVEDAGCGAIMEEGDPADGPGTKVERRQAPKKPRAVEAVIGFREVEEEEASRLMGGLEVVNLLEVGEDVVSDPAARKECGLCDVDGMLKRCAEATSEGFGKELVIGVEQGDGAIVGGVSTRTFALVQEDNQAGQLGRGEARGGSGGIEGGTEGRCQEGSKEVPKGDVELVGEAIAAWMFALGKG